MNLLNILLPVIIIQLILLSVALLDLKKNERVNGPKLMWVFIIIFINLLGPVAYFVFGRRNN
jgi:hypothetical protein